MTETLEVFNEIRVIRQRLGLSRKEFALLLGYIGSDRNNETRVRRLESEDDPHLLALRFLWLVERFKEEHGHIPDWPEHLQIEEVDDIDTGPRDSQKIADRIDGYDRDDLGESPDY